MLYYLLQWIKEKIKGKKEENQMLQILKEKWGERKGAGKRGEDTEKDRYKERQRQGDRGEPLYLSRKFSFYLLVFICIPFCFSGIF